ncbi:tlde1 domain-containing protein [Enterobacter cloacae]|uniref:tlde1 domain-containing protein n=1 Tax=Enterobacter cloacae TaxID=550 RepID=UPI0030F3915C
MRTVKAYVYSRVSSMQQVDAFGLDRQIMTDSILINGISRGSFRLHPLRPDGTGVSEGCITF